MGNAATIIATLELNRGKFKTEVEATEADLEKTQGVFKETAAAVAILERELNNDKGNKALKENLSTLKESLRSTEKEMKLLETQKKRLDAALGTGTAARQVRTIVEDDEGTHGGNARMSNMEAGHSVRSIFGSLGAGQGLGQAFQMELPRLMQAANFGLGAMIGTEAATAIVSSIQKGIEKARELKKEISEALGGGSGGVGYGSSGSLSHQIEQLAETRDKLMPDDAHPDTLLDWGTRQVKNGYRWFTGQQSVEDEKDDQITQLDDRRLQLQGELVKRKQDEAALDAKAFSAGKDAVAVAKAQLETRERIQEIVSDKGLDGDAKAKLIADAKAEGKRRESEAGIEAAAHQRDLFARRVKAETAHPEMNDPDFDVNAAGAGAQGNSVTNARLDLHTAQLNLENVRKAKGNTYEAGTAVEEKTAAFLDAVKASKDELTNAKALTNEMQLQQTGQGALANVVAIRAQYEERIAAALRDGKGDLAAQLRVQEQMAINAARLAAYTSSPGQQLAQRNAQRAEAQLRARFDKDDGLQGISRGIDGKPIDGFDPLLGKRRKFGDRSMYGADGQPLPVASTRDGTKAAEAASNIVDPSFDERFHPKPQVLKPVPSVDPQQLHSADDSNTGDVVDVLEDIKSILDDRLKLTIP